MNASRTSLTAAMRLSSVEIENFRAVERLELPLHERLNVMVGENSAGKTSVIEAIAVGLGAILAYFPECTGRSFKKNDLRTVFSTFLPDESIFSWDGQRPVQWRAMAAPWNGPNYARVALRAESGPTWDRIQRRDKTKRTGKATPRGIGLTGLQRYLDPIVESVQDGGDQDLPIVAYYGTDRAVPDIPQRKRNFRKSFSRFAALDGALEAGFRFKDIFEWFVTQEDVERRAKEAQRDFDLRLPVLDAVRSAVARTLRGCTNPRTELSPLRLVVDMETPAGGLECLALDQLSGGYRVMLALVIDLARRMAQANPHRGKDAIDAVGVVLIDEIDLHLHPRWQQRVISDLRQTFPNLQFIVTTHSPQVLTTVKPEQILMLERETGKVTVAVPTSSYGAKSGRLLTEIMGVEEQPPEDVVDFTRLLNRYRALIDEDRGEEPEANALRRQLDDLSPLEPELVRLDMEIRRRRVLRRARGENA